MLVSIYSNFYNHHQKPLAEELIKIVGKDNFRFIATEAVPQERIEMGYSDMNRDYSYVLPVYESEENTKKAEKLLEESDIVLIGTVTDDYLKRRLNTGKITFKTSERYFKEGLSLHQMPHNFLSAMRHIKRYECYRNYYYLCMSAFTAFDVNKYADYQDRTFKWGYFPEAKRYDVADMMSRKLSVKSGWKHPKVSILWVGRLIGLKHPDVSIELAASLKKKGYSFIMSIIGNGEMDQQLRAMIKEKGVSDCVEMLGAMSPEEVRSHMEQADIFLFTSDFNEGWGAVLNESMNSGCAVVASHAIGSVPFLIHNGENGLIYRYGSQSSFEQAVIKLIENRELRERIGRNAYETIVKQWNAENAAQRLLELANNLQITGETCFKTGVCSTAKVLSNNWFGEERGE